LHFLHYSATLALATGRFTEANSPDGRTLAFP
jgi:hypothetical protein